MLKSLLCLTALITNSLCDTNIRKLLYYLILSTFLHCVYAVVVMNEGNIAAEAGVKDGVSYVEKNNTGTVTAKQLIALKDLEPVQATEKSITLICI